MSVPEAFVILLCIDLNSGMLATTSRFALLFLSLTLLAFPSCTPDESLSDLAPGTMRMISVERVEEGAVDSLLPNGAFATWYGGRPAPSGFRAPSSAAESTLMRERNADHTGYIVRQTWTGPGVDADPAEAFGATVNLKPSTTYRLEVLASATAGLGAGISAMEVDPNGATRVIARNVVGIQGEASAQHVGTFRTVAGGPVMLSSYALGGSTFPGFVVWTSWRIIETAETSTPIAFADRPERRLLVNQALDQLRGQSTLYGGLEAWGAATETMRKHAGGLLGDAALKGKSILGREGYVSGRAELSWLEKHSMPGVSAERADAREAILRAERALAARGVQLIVVPVPERVELYFDLVDPKSAELPVNLTGYAMFVEDLLAKDVVVVNVAPLLWSLKGAGKPIFWRGDTDVPSATLHALADEVAPMLSSLGLVVPGAMAQAYSLKVDTIPLEQRLLHDLPAEQRDQVPPEFHDIQSVRDASGELFQPASGSPVLAVGSLAALHQVRGASFAARLSMALGFPVALPEKNLPDNVIPDYLAAGKAPEVAAAKFVVFCFPERALAEGGWK